MECIRIDNLECEYPRDRAEPTRVCQICGRTKIPLHSRAFIGHRSPWLDLYSSDVIHPLKHTTLARKGVKIPSFARFQGSVTLKLDKGNSLDMLGVLTAACVAM